MSLFTFLYKRVSLFILIVSVCTLIAGLVWWSFPGSKVEVKDEPFPQLEEEYRAFFSTAVPREAKVEELITAGFSNVYYVKENCWPDLYDQNRAEYDNKENCGPDDSCSTNKINARLMASKITTTHYHVNRAPKKCRNLIMGTKPIARVSYEFQNIRFYEELAPMQLEWAPIPGESKLSKKKVKRPMYGDFDYPVLERDQIIKIYVSPHDPKHFIYEKDFMAEMIRGSDDYNKNYWYKKISNPHPKYRDETILVSAIGYIGCHLAFFVWLIFGGLADRTSKNDRKD